MAYQDRFQIADDYLTHLDTVMGGIADPFIQGRYLGFIAISAVTVYELAIKDIFYAFADKKHKVLGGFVRSHFDQINGRIKLASLRDEHIKKFGDKYVEKFNRDLNEKENHFLKLQGTSIKSSYGNLIQWRHSFTHNSTAPAATNYNEMKNAYSAGKEVIHSLNTAMRR